MVTKRCRQRNLYDMSYTIKYRVKTRVATGVAISTERVKEYIKLDVDPRWDDTVIPDVALKNEGSMM